MRRETSLLKGELAMTLREGLEQNERTCTGEGSGRPKQRVAGEGGWGWGVRRCLFRGIGKPGAKSILDAGP